MIVRKNILTIILLSTLFGILITVFFGCPIKAVSGVPCPSCGMTRALLSMFRLDFASAFAYHPLFPVVFLLPAAILVYLIWYAHKQGKKTYQFCLDEMGSAVSALMDEKAVWVLCIGVIALFIAVYFYRMAASILL